MLDFSALGIATEQHPDFDPALAIYDLNRRSEPLEMRLPETYLTPEQHLFLYRDLLRRNMNSFASIHQLQRIVEGTEDGDALGLAISIINGLSKTGSSQLLAQAYQNRMA